MKGDFGRLADYLRSEMAHRDWSQGDLAEQAGVSLRTVNRLMNGNALRLPDKVARIEHAVDWIPGTARRIVYHGEAPEHLLVHPDPQVQDALARMQYLATLKLSAREWEYLITQYEQQLEALKQQRDNLEDDIESTERGATG